MIFENERFIIKYTESDVGYINDAIERVNEKYDEFMKFFGVDELPEKVEFVLYDDLNIFREKMVADYGHVRETTVAHAHKCLVEILTLKERKKIMVHQNSTEDTILMTFAHELLHIFHAFYKGNNRSSWFAEGLAINLGSPRYELSLDDCSVTDLINNKGKSRHFFTMVKYMLDNMSHENILEYAKNDDLVLEHTEEIYNLANEWIRKKSL